MKITIIGSGNVAEHLLKAFSSVSSINLIQVFARNEERGRLLSEKYDVEFCEFQDELKDADLYLLAINDSNIEDFSYKLILKDKLVAHVSGATDIMLMSKHNRRAVFYPLQTFTKGKSMKFSDIPILLEAEYEDDFKHLEFAAKAISSMVERMDFQKRKQLHVVAVFANNFVNHMFIIAKELSDEFSLDFNLLKPLIKETIDKIKLIDPIDAQTGPAVRGDLQTMEKHFELLKDEVHKNLYKQISNSIMNSISKF
jgi:predicted short-subunit dehydrogenase-like oxidoreductase (DUF2520 family)